MKSKNIDLSENREATLSKNSVTIRERQSGVAGSGSVQLTYFELIKILAESYYSFDDMKAGIEKMYEHQEEKDGGILSKFI